MNIFFDQQEYFEIAVDLKARSKVKQLKYYKQSQAFLSLKKQTCFCFISLFCYLIQYYEHFLKYFFEIYLLFTYSTY